MYGYARQSPNRYTDVTGECPLCVAALAAAAGAALAALDEYLDHGTEFRCWNPWKIGSGALGGAAFGAAAPALFGTAAGALGYGNFAVNGMLHSSRAGLSPVFGNVSRQIARATGNM